MHFIGVELYSLARKVMPHVDIQQAEREFAQLIDQVGRGEEVIITKNNRPIAKLTSAVRKQKRQFGSAKGQIWMSEDFDEPLDDFQDYV